MFLEILTPDETIFSGKISILRVPGSKGPFAVLRNHAPIISSLDQGEISIVTEAGTDLFFTLTAGVLEVKNNKITLLAEKIIKEQ
jgi:F-type H+-transporting ATPase subunit epsilon